MSVKFKVEFEIPAIRFVEVGCPDCGQEFDARKHGKGDDGRDIHDAVDLQFATFTCPECHHTFDTRNREIEITE